MITIIKKEIKISKELLSKIEWACAFSKTTPRIINRTKKINDFRKNMDVGIVASRSEAFGRTTIEGMLSQMLIIASNAGSNIELINDGKNGFLYELHNDKQLAKILSNINDNRLLLKEIALNGFEFAKKFTQGDTAK